MLSQVADGVFVHQSSFCQSNAVVIAGGAGALVVDAGVLDAELACLAGDLAEAGLVVVAGFSTHPHWDHLLWHRHLCDAPRWATAVGAETARERLARGIDAKRLGIPDGVSLDLVGGFTGLPPGAERIPWDGPAVRIVEHSAHAPGHAALIVEESGVLIAGDMLSDALVPILDLMGADDPAGDYLSALDLLERAAGAVNVVVPGHGSVGDGDELLTRIDRDRSYVRALRDGTEVADPRVGPDAREGWEWVSDLHTGQAARFAGSA